MRLIQILTTFFIACVLMLLSSCTMNLNRLTWQQAMEIKIKRYAPSAREKLLPYFRRAGVSYPPKKLAFLIFKETRKFEVYARDNSRWKYIRTFPILAASGGPGPKLHSGDDQVPEGIYHIVGLNPESRFDLSLHLNYPNDFDRKYAKLDGRTQLGGDIFIHGNRRSIGCVAIGNNAIEQIFPLVYLVGTANVEVIIAPNDLRISPPIKGSVRPSWLPILYRQIKIALKPFPLPR